MAKRMNFINPISLCFCVLTCLSGFAQEGGINILESITVRQMNNTIRIDFGIQGGAQCQGVKLERSSDSAEFYQIDQIQGICGGSEIVEYYTFIDENPLEYSTNHYRLQLGTQGHTPVVSVAYVRLQENYRVFPNPANAWAVIRFENPNGLDYELQVFDLGGRIIENTPHITSQEIYMDLDIYSPGLYIFQLSNGSNGLITGKFQVTK